MRKRILLLAMVFPVLLLSGCGLLDVLLPPQETTAYQADAFMADMVTAVSEKREEQSWYFTRDTGADQEEMKAQINALLNDSPLGAYLLSEVEYSFLRRLTYDEVHIAFSYRHDAVEPAAFHTPQTIYEAVQAVIAAMESGERELVIFSDALTWDGEAVQDLVSIASTNAVTPMEYRDFAYTCYPGQGSEQLLYLSITMPLEESAYARLDAELQSALDDAAGEILAGGAADAPSLYRAVHDYVLSKAEYDDALAERTVSTEVFSQEDLVARSAHGALVQGSTVCSGYAQAFQGICRELELPCWTVYGTVDANTPENNEHVWNAVRVDDAVYYVDCTFDDGLDSAKYFFFTADDPQYQKYHMESGWLMPW